jgi:hypothetical protein
MTKQFKINPDLTCPELAGYKLPSFPRSQEDDVEKHYSEELDKRWEVAKNYKGQVAGRHPDAFTREEMKGMIRGYMEAREKFEFSEEHIIEAFKKGYLFGADGGGHYLSQLLQSLRTPRTPVAIEVEFKKPIWGESACGEILLLGKEIVLNPDGTVKVVRWVYE